MPSGTSATPCMTWVEPGAGAGGTRPARCRTRASTRCTTSRPYIVMTLAWLRLRPGSGRQPSAPPAASSSAGNTVAQLLAKIVITELAVRRAATPTPRPGWPIWPSMPTGPATCSA